MYGNTHEMYQHYYQHIDWLTKHLTCIMVFGFTANNKAYIYFNHLTIENNEKGIFIEHIRSISNT